MAHTFGLEQIERVRIAHQPVAHRLRTAKQRGQHSELLLGKLSQRRPRRRAHQQLQLMLRPLRIGTVLDRLVPGRVFHLLTADYADYADYESSSLSSLSAS